jgi:hypothetical protein
MTDHAQLPALEFDQLAMEPEDFLASCDVAFLNLAAAKGLPGCETLNSQTCLDKLSGWATRVRIETARHLYRFDPRTQELPSAFHYGNSLGRFLCYFLLQVLQEDCGVRYNLERKFQPDFCQPADLFIHGIVEDNGAGGTCASMPVVYVAVGRRLGYPLKLVEGREHIFCRWDDPRGTLIKWPSIGECWIPPDRFNVEGAGEGIAFHPDSYYIQWPRLWTEVDFSHGRYLQSLAAREEFAAFLMQRGECLWDLGQRGEALKAYWFARKLAPDDRRYEWLHAKRTREYDQHQANEIEFIRELNDRHNEAKLAGLRPIALPSGRPLKIAFGTPIPIDLPLGIPIQYVPADQADSISTEPVPWPSQLNSERAVSQFPVDTGIPFHLRPGTRSPVCTHQCTRSHCGPELLQVARPHIGRQ